MKKIAVSVMVSFLLPVCAVAQTGVENLSKEEEAVVAAILSKANESQEQPAPADPADKIVLPEKTKQEALEQHQELPPQEAGDEPEEEPETETEPSPEAAAKCLTVAFVDIDEAFNAHPRTIAVKEQIRLKILSKEDEVRGAKQLIMALEQENEQLAARVRELKPFYKRIVVETQPLLPRVEEPADALVLGNLLNRLTFAGAESMAASPLNTPAQIDELAARIASNKKIIAERNFFIDNYKYTTREEIISLEKKEVNEILQDIYKEIKSFAKKRNIGAVVRKEDVLYGEKPVNVTKDFINRLKKSKKYRKRGK